jgi:hypothetical protein
MQGSGARPVHLGRSPDGYVEETKSLTYEVYEELDKKCRVGKAIKN